MHRNVLLVVNCGSSSRSQKCVSKQHEWLLKAGAHDKVWPQTVTCREDRKDFVKSTLFTKPLLSGVRISGGSAPEILLHGSYFNLNHHFPVQLICVFVSLQFSFFLR